MISERDRGTEAMERVRAALAAAYGVSDWQLDWHDEREAQLYLSGRQVETRRLVTSRQARLTVYNDHVPAAGGDGPARGWASITLTGAQLADPARIAARIETAVAMARLMDTRPYPLPEQPAGSFPAVLVADPALGGDLSLALEGAREMLDAALRAERDVRLASAELCATATTRALENSRGLRGEYDETRVRCELTFIAGEDPDAAEFHAVLSRRRLADLNLTAAVPAYVSFARDAACASVPPTHVGPVLLSGLALPDLFSPLVMQSSARIATRGLSRLKLGTPISSELPRGDHITLLADRLRPYALRSAPFDWEGLPATRFAVIQDGILSQIWGDARYAAYAGMPPTGEFGNVTLARGTAPLSALRATAGGPLYEIVAFSWLRPDPLTGDFASEIKLGYRHEPGGSSVPIKGGSLSGNLFTALLDARLSAEQYSDGSYYGPAAIRFGDLTISGA